MKVTKVLSISLLFVFVTVMVAPFSAAHTVQAQEEGGIVCDDATILIWLIAEINGYSVNESTLIPSMDTSVFDKGENAPFFDLLVPTEFSEDMIVTDEIVQGILPLAMEIETAAEGLTDTEGPVVEGEDPACTELRNSVLGYVAFSLLWDYQVSQAE
jgi:hypothetical protein